MSETTNDALILDELIIGEPMSQHLGVRCCPAIHESTDERYIVKILSIPASKVQLDALLLTGAYTTPAHALEYFHDRAEEVLEEVNTLKKLHTMEGFLPYTHAEIRKAENDIGYQVYLVSPYKRSLERQMQLEPLTHLGAVNLGLDLCAALAICRRAGHLYIDLKPSNVFLTPNQGYRISDLGFISLKSLKYASYPEQYRSAYTAPEIADAMSSLNDRIDIYALGLILYQVYNNGELPPETDGPLPPPAYADYEIAEIILKACDPNPAKRWSDPLKMGQAIVAYMQRNSINDTPIVPPPVEIPPEPVVEEAAQTPEDAEPEETADEVTAVLDGILEDIAQDAPVDEDDAAQMATEDIAEDLPPASNEESDAQQEILSVEDLPEDETVPTEESAGDIQIEQVSDEVQQMLARADELIAHELPEPAVAPEPIDVPFPAPIVLAEDDTKIPQEATENSTAGTQDTDTSVPVVPEKDDPEDVDAANEIAPDDDVQEQTDVAVPEPKDATETPEVTASEGDDAADDADEEVVEEDDDWDDEDAEYRVSEFYSDEERLRVKRRKPRKALVIIACCIALLAVLAAGATLFYQYYYLQPVDAIAIDGSVDSLTAEISSSIKDELLSVVCTDTYGNSRTESVINGRAHFTNLTPNTQYRVQLNISGFHRLDGITSSTFTTAAQTEILNFNAVAGPEDGSVILSFTVNGPESDSWTVGYSTDGAQETLQSFTGHTVTITGLTVGSEYLFRLIPNDDQYLSGTWQLRYTAQQIVYAQELSILSCANGVLVAAWNIPEGMEGQSWNVRCYNDNGYDKTLTVSEPQVQFTELDHAYGYTVEVTAIGMTQSSTATVSANPITLTAITATTKKNSILKLDWTYSGEAPAEGWILDYTVDGGAPITISCPENSAQITRYPGSKYEIDVRPVGEVTYFGQHLSHQVEKAAKFSGFGVTADDMSFYMCLTPKKTNWDRFDVPASDYKTSFKAGTKASFLVELWKNYQKSDNKVTVTYIIRTEAGVPVSLNNVDSTWNKLWDKKFCELDIPQMPETAGKYTVEILFNGQQIVKKAFTVT